MTKPKPVQWLLNLEDHCRQQAAQVLLTAQKRATKAAKTWHNAFKQSGWGDQEWIDRRTELLTHLEPFLAELFDLPFEGEWLHGPVHKPLLRHLDTSCPLIVDRPKRQTSNLYLASRNTFKTSIFLPRLLQVTIRDPDVRSQIGGFTQDQSEYKLGLLKGFLDSDQAYFWFPDVIWRGQARPPEMRWDKKAIDLKGRKRLVDPSISAVSYGTSVTGAHGHNRLLDDVVNEKSCNTPDLLEQTIATWEYLYPCSSLDLIEDVVGTFYDREDLYNWMINKGLLAFKWVVPAMVTKEWIRDYPQMQEALDFDSYELGKLLFENRLTAGVLDDAAARLSDYVFGCQFLLNPTAKTAKLKPEWLLSFKHTELPSNVLYYMTADPGASKAKSASEGALVVCAWTHDAHCYIVDLEAGQWNTREFCQRAVSMYRRWAGPDFMEFGMELVAFQAAVHDAIRLIADAEGIADIPLVELPGHYLGVGRRVDKLSAPASMGRIHCAEHLRPELLPQWERFPDPTGKRMDRLDALSYQLARDNKDNPWVQLPYEPMGEIASDELTGLLPSQRPPESRKKAHRRSWRQS